MSASGSSIAYGYNADGKRISKTVNGTTYNYAYLGDQLTEMTWGSNKLHFTYDSIGPASVTYNGTTYLYVKNAQGDVVQIVDGNGNTVVTYIYDAWGNMLYHYGSHVDDIGKYNPFRYRGYVYDTETGLYYLNSRYYNPTWGRFVNADTAAVVAASPDKANWDKNLFAYCDNNPISRKDDGGEFWNTIIGAVVGGITAGITNGHEEGVGRAILRGAVTGAIAGLGLDLCIATGGVVSVIAVMGLGGFSSGLDNFWSAKNKGQDVNYAEMAIDAAVGALTNLAFGAYGMSPDRVTGKTVTEIFNVMCKNTVSNVTSRSGRFLLNKAAKNVAMGIIESTSQVWIGKAYSVAIKRMIM